MKFEMKINGRKVTSASQIERELTKAAEDAVEESIRKAAGPGVRIKKTREGYIAEGSPDQIDRLTRRLR
jgi:methionine aminopeptidase